MLYALAFDFQFGAPIEAAYDVDNWRIWKQHIAKTTPSPKVLLIGGSGILFGMDSAYLEGRVGIPVVNHGLHGGMPLDWLLDVSLKYVTKNDIVVLSLEWPYLLEDYTTTNSWVANQVIAWNPGYFRDMNLHRKLEFFLSMSPATVLANVGARIQSLFRTFPRRRTYDEVEALDTYDRKSGS